MLGRRHIDRQGTGGNPRLLSMTRGRVCVCACVIDAALVFETGGRVLIRPNASIRTVEESGARTEYRRLSLVCVASLRFDT